MSDQDRPVTWDLRAPVVAFSDGACIHNGKPNAVASFSAVVIGAQFALTAIYGKVPSVKYTDAMKLTHEPIMPSNNRGEVLGIIYVFLTLLHGRAAGHVEIWSDSLITVNTLNKWLPARIQKNTAHELKNYDLLMIAWKLLLELRAKTTSVTIGHTRSHEPAPHKNSSIKEQIIWKGNHTADKYASRALSSTLEIDACGPASICQAVMRNMNT